MFTWLLATVSDVIKPTGKLCRGNVLLMVVMKHKLNLTNNDLAMRFQTCPTQLLEVGDLVLADRGFLIADELAAHGASLAIPPFAKGKSQFSQREVECARRLSKSRIHVERAIERTRKFYFDNLCGFHKPSPQTCEHPERPTQDDEPNNVLPQALDGLVLVVLLDLSVHPSYSMPHQTRSEANKMLVYSTFKCEMDIDRLLFCARGVSATIQ
ncbi:hypothetical protein MAR_024175, partial [Mya arenaria]